MKIITNLLQFGRKYDAPETISKLSTILKQTLEKIINSLSLKPVHSSETISNRTRTSKLAPKTSITNLLQFIVD